MLSYQNVLLDSMKVRDIKLKHNEEFKLDGIRFHPQQNVVRVGMDTVDIAERIALCMSACVLYALCDQGEPSWGEQTTGKGKGHGCGDATGQGYGVWRGKSLQQLDLLAAL